MMGHGLVGLGDQDDPREQGDLVAAEALRIAASVEPLVVVTDRASDLRQRRLAAEDLGPADRMDPHLLHLVLGQHRGLAEDVLRGGEVADVVERRRDEEA
jgi:hypothetical protein